MINANELRIGNILMFTQFQENTDMEITGTHIAYAGNDQNWLNSFFEPIPLTEEWLVRFGWKDGFAKGMLIRYGLKIRLLGHDMDTQYVHQLQNLYFALTGQELHP